MAESPRRRDLRRLLLGPVALVVRGALRVLGSSWRYQVLHPERLEALLAAPRPVVVSFWHDQSFAAAWFLYRQLHCRGLELTLLASDSRDGELVVRILRPWKLRVVRGSASRGGRAAILGLYRSLRSHASSPVVIPDGPRGPKHRFKAGGLLLSQLAQEPILPLAFAPERPRHLRSWDRMMVPRWRSRIAVAVGELEPMPRDMSSGEIERQRARMEECLTALFAEAEGHFAGEPSARGNEGGRTRADVAKSS